MSKSKPKSLSELLLETGSPLQKLANEAARNVELSDDLRELVPEILAPGVLQCNLRDDGTLVVSAASPEWAARLRFQSTALLERCRANKKPAIRVKIRVSSSATQS
ncbi:MAG: DciA family protein [Gammaproteobacteria bacterium]